MIYQFTVYKGASSMPEVVHVNASSMDDAVHILKQHDYTIASFNYKAEAITMDTWA